ncbi:phospholipase D-like domain-containing protein [Meiothermus sp.]|uniref:phospholipase D-like domain-containing protein n=1 Tax=Meiothermus sp. TaxID=1955249 RepID=UPI0021DEFCBC|nr:phospholipase D-like domain-containing protein [Meiothermus sp.]GIW26361.1 MAG: hypothetical protein KatS3mg069_2628 [Meiothermus sp.]
MEVVVWQLFVIASVALSYLIKGRKVSFWIAVAWTAWTAVMIFALPLALVQLFFCWGTYLVCRKIDQLIFDWRVERRMRKEREAKIEELMNEVARLTSLSKTPKRRKDVLFAAARSNPDSIKIIAGDEHYSVLQRALADAKESVAILSGWVGAPLLDPCIQNQMREALMRGVKITIGFGWESSLGHELNDIGKQALDFLLALRTSFPALLNVAKFPNHEKVLVCDSQWVVIGSNNWLSNRTFRNSERSIFLRDPSFADSERRRIECIVSKHRGSV